MLGVNKYIIIKDEIAHRVFGVQTGRFGFRLCKDGLWRSHANFGDYRSCVQDYKSRAAAIRRAKKCGGQVVELPEGLHIEASGYCYVTTGPEETCHQRFLTDYIIWPKGNHEKGIAC
jgi:hypothetical protein